MVELDPEEVEDAAETQRLLDQVWRPLEYSMTL